MHHRLEKGERVEARAMGARELARVSAGELVGLAEKATTEAVC